MFPPAVRRAGHDPLAGEDFALLDGVVAVGAGGDEQALHAPQFSSAA